MQKHVALFVVVVLSTASRLLAQDTAEFYNHGYGFFAAGSNSGSALMHFGGGGEAGIYRGLGAGAEIGYLTRFADFGDGFGVFSPNGVYQFPIASTKLTPFATGGYSLAFRSGTAHGFNFGGGVHYSLSDRSGLRLEFRDQVFDFGTFEHFYGFRLGISFR